MLLLFHLIMDYSLDHLYYCFVFSVVVLDMILCLVHRIGRCNSVYFGEEMLHWLFPVRFQLLFVMPLCMLLVLDCDVLSRQFLVMYTSDALSTILHP